MADRVDPREFGLAPRTHLEREADNRFTLVINRKSRLIMADGKKIAGFAEKIRAARPDCKVTLRTTAPVCSKTRAFLSGIGIETIE